MANLPGRDIHIFWHLPDDSPSDTIYNDGLGWVDLRLAAESAESSPEQLVVDWQKQQSEMMGGSVLAVPWGWSHPVPEHKYLEDSSRVSPAPMNDQTILIMIELQREILGELKSLVDITQRL